MNPAWMELLPVLPDPDRKCPCRVVDQDRVCFRRRPSLPSTLRQMPDMDWSLDLVDGIPRAWLLLMLSTLEYGTLPNGCGVNTQDLQVLQSLEPAAYMNWLLDRKSTRLNSSHIPLSR